MAKWNTILEAADGFVRWIMYVRHRFGHCRYLAGYLDRGSLFSLGWGMHMEEVGRANSTQLITTAYAGENSSIIILEFCALSPFPIV
jgi:hypothetical protein